MYTGFVRREAIISCDSQETIGYELALKNSRELLGDNPSPILQRMHDQLLLKSILALGIPPQTGKQPVFIRVPPDTLEEEQIFQLSGRNIVFMFHPEARNAQELLIHCRKLKTCGFRFCLDDFSYSSGLYPLLGMADYLCFDIGHNSAQQLEAQLEQIPRLCEKTLIARNVHSPEQLDFARHLSFRHYQGKDQNPSAPKDEPAISRCRIKIIMVMNMLNDRADAGKIEAALKLDGALAYRLLRYINSPANGQLAETPSIADALTKLGYDTLHRWLGLMLFCQDTSPCRHDRPLLENALLRGRLTELFGQHKLSPDEKSGLFVTGLFSSLDLLFRMPLARALSHFSLPQAIEDALLRQHGPYVPFLKLAIACEDHDPARIEHYARLAGISIEQVNASYVRALVWAHEIES